MSEKTKSQLDVDSLQAGTVFRKYGHWFTVIDSVLQQQDGVALVKCHEDDGFIQYYLFEDCGDHWHTTYSSQDQEAMEHQMKIILNYNKSLK